MALAAVLHSNSASVVPLVTRAVQSQRALSTLFSVQSRGPGLCLGLSLGQKLTRPSFVPIATFSTDADENLLRVLEAEIVRVNNPNVESVPTVMSLPSEEPPSFPMRVTVSKEDGQFLLFGIIAFADGIRIDSLSIMDCDDSDDLTYEGPEFENLDENLRKALQKYLEARGFDNKVMSFLLDYKKDKKAKKYLLWLNNLKEFVEK